jgi:hypothetical protein
MRPNPPASSPGRNLKKGILSRKTNPFPRADSGIAKFKIRGPLIYTNLSMQDYSCKSEENYKRGSRKQHRHLDEGGEQPNQIKETADAARVGS